MPGPFEVTHDVYCVGGSGISGSDDCMVYLIDCENNEFILVDSGVSHPEKILSNVERLGFEPKRISHHIITHCHIDHIGNSAKLKKMLRFKVYAHTPDSDVIEKGGPATGASFYGVSYEPLKVDVIFTKPEESFSIGKHEVKILHVPGHTLGGICPYIDVSGERVIFAQDVHGPIFEELGSDRKQFTESLKKERDLNADILCEGHFGIFKGKEKVKKYIEGYIREFSV
jgi:glyoxylase-like metal-dependent hydrolase (beta-lactamase superfamily II)